MSLKALTWAFDQALDPGSKLTLLALADFADDKGRSFPSMRTLAEKTSLSVRTVRDRLRKLEDLGYLKTAPQERRDGSQTSNEYILLDPSSPGEICRGGGEPGEGGRQASAALEPSSNRQEKPPVVPQDDDFDAIWQSWPRKDSKKAAQARWSRLSAKKREEITPLIVAHANAFRQNVPPLYVPYLTSFLKDERWGDPLAVSRERGAYKPEPQAPTQRVIPQGHIPVRDQNGQIIGSRPA